MLKLIYATKCSMYHMHPQFYNQDSEYFTLTLTVLPGVAVPHLEREALLQGGTTALEPWHCRDLSDRGGLGGIYTLPLPPQWLSASSFSLQHVQNRAGALSLPSLLTSSPQANPLISPSILKEKGSQTRLESSSINFPTLKSTWFTF